MSIVSLFCEIHDFFMMYETHLATHCLPNKTTSERRGRRRGLHASEVMTLLVAFHQSNYRTLKHFYEKHVCVYWCSAFPNLVSYPRFVQLQQEVLTLLRLYLHTRLGGAARPPSSIRRHYASAITDVSQSIAFSWQVLNVAKTLWDGSTGLNSISSSTMPVNFCRFFSHLPIPMTGSLWRSWCPQVSLAISTQIEAISQKTYVRCSASEVST